jgi:hypothetical protein
VAWPVHYRLLYSLHGTLSKGATQQAYVMSETLY